MGEAVSPDAHSSCPTSRHERTHPLRNTDGLSPGASASEGERFDGTPCVVADVASALTARDEIDRTRAASPLYAAKDAVLLDTTGQSIDDVVAQVLTLVDLVLRA